MKKIFTILLLIICACQATIAKPSSDNDKKIIGGKMC